MVRPFISFWDGTIMASEYETKLKQKLAEQWQVQERPFTSNAPLIGPLIVRLRRFWNNLSTTWYVRPLLQQQNEFNHLLTRYLDDLTAIDAELNGRLTVADRDQVDLSRQLAELTYAVNRMNQRLSAIEAQLTASDTEPSS
jgi:hypothetical protein